MAYDHQEQEQLESVKIWWADNGNTVLTAVCAVLLSLAAWNGWNYWQRQRTLDASVLYETVQKSVVTKDIEKLKRATTDMTDKFSGTPYAEMTGLQAAKSLYDAKDLAGAKARLQWLVEHATHDEFRHLARLRLVNILLEEKAYDEAAKLLTVEPSTAFAALYAERRGDLYWAQDKLTEARDAYRQALSKADSKDAVARQLIQLKLDTIGGA